MSIRTIIPAHDLAIEYVPLEALRPNPRNARTHGQAQLRKLRDAIANFGWVSPIIVDDDGMILAGHARYEVARMLALVAVPAVRLRGMTESQKRAYVLADNKLAELAGYDKGMLADELAFLVEHGDALITGFDSLEIDTLLTIHDGEETDGPPVELPAPERQPISRVGDLWHIGAHRLLCGNALLPESYDRLLDGEKAQLVISDPPYNVPIAGHVSGLGRKAHREFAMASGEMTRAEFTGFLRTSFRQLAGHASDGALAFVFMDWRHMAEVLDAANGVMTEFKNLIVWAKTNAGMGSFYRSQHELIFAFKIGRAPHINNFGLGGGGRHRSNLWTYAGATTFRKGRAADLDSHPTVKPVCMIADAIRDCSHRNGLVLDPFLGAGTTLVAAARAGRRGAGTELDPAYVDVAIRRLMKETGEIAFRDDGMTFVELERDSRDSKDDQ